jgi:CRISPR-associated protein Csc1
MDVHYAITQYNTMPETFALPKRQSIGYPEWGFIRCARPSSRYRFYILARGGLSPSRFIRLGKFMAKARLESVEAPDVQRLDVPFATPALLNLEDLLVPPVAFDLIANALPSRLVQNAAFPQAPHVRARFPEGTVALPLAMAYPGGQSCESL